LLKMFEDEELLVPKNIIGLTGFEELVVEYEKSFQLFDFCLYSFMDYELWSAALITKIKWIQKSKNSEERHKRKTILITVHGIHTAGVWQVSLTEAVTELDSDVVKMNFKAPYISALRLLFPRIRSSLVDAFSRDLDALIRQHPDGDFFFFGHSFGTFILAEKLRMMEPVNSPRIKAVVLAGSVLRRDFPWVDIKKNLNLPLVVNDCGIKDFPLILSEIFAPGLGMAGKKGFYTFENGVVTNRFFNGGHSFFEKKTDFYTEYWLPIIRGDEPVPSPKIRISKYHDFLESFTDGIKYYFWGVALFLLSLSIIF